MNKINASPNTRLPGTSNELIVAWLDGLVNTSPQNIDTTALFRRFVKCFLTFDSKEAVKKFILSSPDNKIILMVSGRLGQEIMDHIHHLPQLKVVYVYCMDKERNQRWAIEYPKIKGVIVAINDLIRQIILEQMPRNEYELYEQLPICFYHKRSRLKSSGITNNDFVGFQLLLNSLGRIQMSPNAISRFVMLCKEEYRNDSEKQHDLRYFEENYVPHQAIYWYTKHPFFGDILRKALQPHNVELLFYSYFIFADIRKQLEADVSKTVARTYRSLIMPNQQVRLLNASLGDWFSINTFFLTTIDRKRAVQMFDGVQPSADYKQVLFEIECDPELAYSIPHGDITWLNYSRHENVIMFMAGTMFHPVDICEENGITYIQMEVCCDKDQEMKVVFEDLKAEGYDEIPCPISLGNIIILMKRYDDAVKYFTILLDQYPHSNLIISKSYQALGRIALETEDYQKSIEWLQKAISMDQAVLKSEDPQLVYHYTLIASVYAKHGSFDMATEYYLKALKILFVTLGDSHPQVAVCLQGVGDVLDKQNKYSEALIYFEKALRVYQKNPSTPLESTAQLHNRIADVCISMNRLTQALSHYKLMAKALREIYPCSYSDIKKAVKCIASTYEALNNPQKAKDYYEKLAKIQMDELPENHPEVIAVIQDIQRLSNQLNDTIVL